ncbi:serine hydrolase domain-containing protein [Stackebrandtia soli]|uniref:serine hydrolase domain-containing protein n=1 Tax=Stackebrandtia soli TaxID=1892856 RepID=UPI0039E8F49C
MRKGLLLSTALLVGAFGLPSAAAADTDGPDIDPALMESTLDELYDAVDASVLIEVRDGDEVWTDARGDRDPWTGTDTRPTDRVRLASLTKSMVTTVVLQLVDEGTLSLDDTVEEHLPGLLPYEQDFTVDQLLGHTSGIPDYFGAIYPSLYELSADDVRTNRYDHYAPEELIEAATANPLWFAPGSSWGYSNTNYYIVGLILEKATGSSLESLVTKRVVKPADMDSSYFTKWLPFLVWPAPSGYFATGEPDDPRIDTSGLSPSQMWAAGGMAGNPRDVNRFFRAMYDGTLLPPELAEQAMTPSAQSGGYYGLGTESLDLVCPGMPDGRAYGHTGGGLGYSTLSFHSVDGQRQVTLTYAADLQLAPTDELQQAAVRTLIAGLCSIDVSAPAVARTATLPTVADIDRMFTDRPM